MSAAETTVPAGTPPVPGAGSSPRLNQPWRALVALAEVVVAVLLVLAAVWAWRSAAVVVEFPAWREGDPVQRVTRYYGHWMASAVGLAALAGFALLDALRQLVLAVRAGGRGRRRR
ncbi:hypothetical protein LX15_005458 [Streptoalloteichus tenebrarius]|uniref:Uncharacterized protein n=1 Tax=Streptoalloteichus tenebrarius (strain ATCC 17920 / DSM 40477 / JCM 4838 / CBS 697.72 / NBRC 16177 / NCIMB 11028 / NRRL B-12390 / A12253. 1 / ISP 5477) TaxID=1933 RepID=A0ABT1I1R2_STRSD|nr:hypothetical protein [Streptoalloteichus tenebrarius]MCP2261732.1 hypothetical protein [Streptoalloteichus tenebrarius]BFF02445.1 hypothetical protein GCM10020241_41200 [Streptoalloteichus tenebrarius]